MTGVCTETFLASPVMYRFTKPECIVLGLLQHLACIKCHVNPPNCRGGVYYEIVRVGGERATVPLIQFGSPLCVSDRHKNFSHLEVQQVAKSFKPVPVSVRKYEKEHKKLRRDFWSDDSLNSEMLK